MAIFTEEDIDDLVACKSLLQALRDHFIRPPGSAPEREVPVADLPPVDPGYQPGLPPFNRRSHPSCP